MVLKLPGHPIGHRADDLFQRLPLPVDLNRPGFQAGHVQDIADDPVQVGGFLNDGLQQFLRLAASRSCSSRNKVVPAPVMAARGVRRS